MKLFFAIFFSFPIDKESQIKCYKRAHRCLFYLLFFLFHHVVAPVGFKPAVDQTHFKSIKQENGGWGGGLNLTSGKRKRDRVPSDVEKYQQNAPTSPCHLCSRYFPGA